MKIAIITGAGGLIGSQAVEYFIQESFQVMGIDNDMRKDFFGEEASTLWNIQRLQEKFRDFKNYNFDIRDQENLEGIFKSHKERIDLIIHTAAQPSHDWAAKDPHKDFTVNANGTLVLLELCRKYCPQAIFIFTSTNKVYGDAPNYLPLEEKQTRWEIDPKHPFTDGVDESMPVDQTLHSLFGASKLAADILVQEYARYFGLKTGTFRGGCLTGSSHSGVELHGFLSYLMKCAVTGQKYTIFGYKGKQVRDNIHSFDLVTAFHEFYKKPRAGEVYNIGGGRFSNCSILEAIELCEKISGKKIKWEYVAQNRKGDHIWYISSLKKFKEHYPRWRLTYTLEKTLEEIYQSCSPRWQEIGRP